MYLVLAMLWISWQAQGFSIYWLSSPPYEESKFFQDTEKTSLPSHSSSPKRKLDIKGVTANQKENGKKKPGTCSREEQNASTLKERQTDNNQKAQISDVEIINYALLSMCDLRAARRYIIP